VFCPNCGTKNDETATPCTKCGFKLTAAPKFRGTIMLNSDQSVHDMVEEHRRKLAEAGGVQAPADGPGAVPGAPAGSGPPPSPSVAPKAVLQPPRAGLPKRRMGTMLGVAPQIGGVQPPEPTGSSSPSPTPPPVSPQTLASASVQVGVPSAPDPFAGTVAFGAVAPAAPAAAAHPLAPGRTEAFAAVPAPVAGALAAGRTEASAAAPPPVAPALVVGRTEALAAVPEQVSDPVPPGPVKGRTEAFGALPVQLDEVPESAPPEPVRRRRIHPLEIFLIVITFGLYGLVILARQRRPKAKS
jgi:zinc-ribbon domain